MTSRVPFGRVTLAALLASSVLAACDTKLTEVTGLVGPRAFDFSVGTAALGLPRGHADRDLVRTLVQRHQVTYSATGAVLADVVLTLPSGHTQDTTATDSAAVVMVGSLRALGGGAVYQVWAQSPDGSISPAYGRVTEYSHYYTGENDPITGDSIFARDSSDVAVSGGGTYTGSDDVLVDSVAFRVIPSDPGNTVNPFLNSAVNAVFVTIESGPATTPSNVRFLWRRVGVATGGSTSSDLVLRADTVVLSANPFGAGDPVPDTIEVTRHARRLLTGSGALTLGNYGGLDVLLADSPNDYVYAPRGGGKGGARGPELSVDLNEMARPPIGFFYRGYLVNASGSGVIVDTLRSAWSMDSTISRVSLYNADVDPALPGIEGMDIRAAQVRNCAAGSGVNNCQNALDLPATDTFKGLAEFELKLEPKAGVAAGPKKSIALTGPLPSEVK
jgi:hypothetical protein